MIDGIASKTVDKDEEDDNRGKRSNTLNEVKLAENRSKNPQSFVEISSVQKEVATLCI